MKSDLEFSRLETQVLVSRFPIFKVFVLVFLVSVNDTTENARDMTSLGLITKTSYDFS